jgi:hypothetical protein
LQAIPFSWPCTSFSWLVSICVWRRAEGLVRVRTGGTGTSDLEEFPRTHAIDFVSIILDGPAGNDCLTLQRRSNVRAREPGNSVLAPPDERLTTDLSRVKPSHGCLLETIAADPTLAPRPRSARGRDRSRLQQVQESCVHQRTIPAATTSATCPAIRRLRERTAAHICPPGGLSWSEPGVPGGSV